MSWEHYLDQLDSELALRLSQSAIAEARDLALIEAGSITLAQRLRAVVGKQIAVTLRCGQLLHLRVERVGKDWMYGDYCGQSLLVPLAAITQVRGLARVQTNASIIDQRLSFAATLRRLTTEVVQLRTRENQMLYALVLAVWSDHLDLRTEGGDLSIPLSEVDYLGSATAG